MRCVLMRAMHRLSTDASLQRENELPLFRFLGCHGEAVALAQQNHVFKLFRRMFAQLLERDQTSETTFELHIDHVPAWLGRVAFRVVVIVLTIEGGGVGVAFLHYLHDGDDSWYVGARIVEKRQVTELHVVLEHVARLVIAHSIPPGGVAFGTLQVLDAEGSGLGLHQPVAHLMILSSVTTASSRTS